MDQIDWRTKSLEDVNRLGRVLANAIREHLEKETNLVVCLDGILGAGKTTLTSKICRNFGIPRQQISSPTFSLQNMYHFDLGEEKVLVQHFDFYRINDEDELLETGFEEAASQRGVILIEWANRFRQFLPPSSLNIEIEHVSESERDITIQSQNGRLLHEIKNLLVHEHRI